MSRFFLHLCERSDAVVDTDGVDLVHEDAAVQRAIRTIRDVVANDILAGMPVRLASYISVQDQNGTELRRVYFRDAISFEEEPADEAASDDDAAGRSAFFPTRS